MVTVLLSFLSAQTYIFFHHFILFYLAPFLLIVNQASIHSTMRLLFLATIVLPLAAVCINAEPIKNLNFNQYLNHGKSFLGKISSHIQRIFFKTPDFCNGLECPKFEVKKKTSSYELRCYPAYKWAGTAVEGQWKPRDHIKLGMRAENWGATERRYFE